VQQGQNNKAFALLANAASRSEIDAEAVTTAFSIRAMAQAASSPLLGTEQGNNTHAENSLLHDALRSAQRAIMMRPSEIKGWQALEFVRSRMS